MQLQRGSLMVQGPGSKGHEQTDATSYAVWTLDFIKSDSCSATQVPVFVL